jgi:lactoylglutathione lyase
VKIEHLALWTRDLERLCEFYVRHFDCVASDRYTSTRRPFTSYFLRFPEGARLELMHVPDLAGADDVAEASDSEPPRVGLAHFALSVGSEAAVRETTERLRAAGVRVVGEPRWTGDGYFESVVLDPDDNSIEITI